ncbi:MAG: GlsB/YeaQ/YmgE family stress response membrane protein [Planctomycetota bacterium]|nr:GlsB/YeaQ/YmgE family stress response membrane protein [Planctomycetota bacterium]
MSSLAQSLVGYSHGGCLVSIVLGLIGAILGTWLARLVGMDEILAIQIGGHSFPIVWSIIGAALFVAMLSLLTSRQRE